jgi:mono/diheme cytochrome c family protein
MTTSACRRGLRVLGVAIVAIAGAAPASAQLVDRSQTPNAANEGIAKSLPQQIGRGRGDVDTPDTSAYIIARDPFRAIRRGRQLFQRKFTDAQGQGPRVQDGVGDIGSLVILGAGLSDSCAGCHGRPRGAAGSGGDVATRPDSRDAPHLFGLGLKEMLADEITADLRRIRAGAITEAVARRRRVTRELISKGIRYGSITADADGSVDTSRVQGVDRDLRVRPFAAHGGTISIREFVVGALNVEMGLPVGDPDVAAASAGGRVITPSGMVLDGRTDVIERPPVAPGSGDLDPAVVDFLEFYLLNYFKAGRYEETIATHDGRRVFERIGCTSCHIPDLPIERDRRVADVETVYDKVRGIFNNLFATATPLHGEHADTPGRPTLKPPLLGGFLVKNIYTDLKRHDLGPNFHERNYDGTLRTQFMTTPLWGVGTTAPYGHDGRSINLKEVILRHGGEAERARNHFDRAPVLDQLALIEFLNSLIIFPPDDTASNLDPGNPATPGFPQAGHGSIKLGVLFNDPNDRE